MHNFPTPPLSREVVDVLAPDKVHNFPTGGGLTIHRVPGHASYPQARIDLRTRPENLRFTVAMTTHPAQDRIHDAGLMTVHRAAELGISGRVLRGPRFRRLFRGVYAPVDHEMTTHDWHTAAALSLTPQVHLSHVSRIQAAGLDIGPGLPVHFTTELDSSAKREGIFVHRTDTLPPLDEAGVTPAAALIGYAASASALDVIVAADWLLHHEQTTLPALRTLATDDAWRPGADAVRRLLHEFDVRAASLPESRCRMFVVAAGLPRPEVNVRFLDDPGCPVNDLLIRRWRVAIEYEGLYHFTTAAQWTRDIDRYAWMRRNDLAYVQVYAEKLRDPRRFVMEVFQALRRQGYDGSAPDFGARWKALFAAPSRTGWKARRRPRHPRQ